MLTHKFCAVALSGLSLVIVGCTSQMRTPDTCGEQRAPFGQSALAWQRTRAQTVKGTVTAAQELVPIQSAIVTLALFADTASNSAKLYHALTDMGGGFHIDSVPTARYLLRVRALEYREAIDTIQLVADSGILVRAIMVPQNFIADCSFPRHGGRPGPGATPRETQNLQGRALHMQQAPR
jgi:Carboxypeptidase regulatory-like domain